MPDKEGAIKEAMLELDATLHESDLYKECRFVVVEILGELYEAAYEEGMRDRHA